MVCLGVIAWCLLLYASDRTRPCSSKNGFSDNSLLPKFFKPWIFVKKWHRCCRLITLLCTLFISSVQRGPRCWLIIMQMCVFSSALGYLLLASITVILLALPLGPWFHTLSWRNFLGTRILDSRSTGMWFEGTCFQLAEFVLCCTSNTLFATKV